MKLNNSILPTAIVVVTAFAIGLYAQRAEQQPEKSSTLATLPTLQKAIILPNSKVISGIDFSDHLGQPFSRNQLLGKWSILFFGFSNCPDICPTTLHTLAQVKQNLIASDAWGNYQVIMVSVDPARDTPEQLGNYVPFFDPDFIGISSDLSTTTEFAKQLGILFVARQPDSNQTGKPARYDVDHSTSIILLNPQAEMAGVISSPHKVDEISADLKALRQHFSADHAIQMPSNFSTQSKAAQGTISSEQTNAVKQSSNLRLQDAWIRPAPANSAAMAGYFQLSNRGKTDITLSHLESTAFSEVMMHENVVEDQITRMQHLPSLTIKAKSSITFAPSGKHLMLIEPLQPLPVGSNVEVVFISDSSEDDDEQRWTFTIPVQAQP